MIDEAFGRPPAQLIWVTSLGWFVGSYRRPSTDAEEAGLPTHYLFSSIPVGVDRGPRPGT
jgi:hypothetical protein